ncbi:MAG: ferrochelatase [Alcanivoracaceae bacterium]|nr:ferrochelatase [Alcanivoracaceae bacterium]
MFKGQADFSHDTPLKVGVLLTNLGTPDAPTPSALRRYLAEFLWDPRVVEVPRPLWWLILHGIILRVRPRKSAHAYASVWTEDGSPLLLHTRDQAQALQQRLAQQYGDAVVVDYAMRYGSPGISPALERLQQQGVDRLLVLPLYPQYSAATGGSTFDALAADLTRRRWVPGLRFINHYHDFPPYIEAMAAHIEAHWQAHGRHEKLLLSYHGVPLRYLHQGDPYHCECHKTSRLLAERLGLSAEQYMTTFQSRFGREEWLQPYTDETLKALPGQGVASVDVFCPGFSADCLETLEEIAVENRDYFLEAGGRDYAYISALNATAGHVDALAALVTEHLQGWAVATQSTDTLAQRRERATTLGAAR